VVHPELIGFGPFFSSQLSLEELQSSLVGRAVADRGRSLHVRFPDGAHPVVVPGRLRAEGILPVVGDFVVASPGPDRTVTRVLERRTWLSRNVAGGATAEQVLAANVDVVFVVQGLDAWWTVSGRKNDGLDAGTFVVKGMYERANSTVLVSKLFTELDVRMRLKE
jgi:ribosome biogenesis GTPase